MEQTEMGNAEHAKIIPGPKRQALPLLNSDFLFLLSPSASSASPLPFPFRSSLRYHPPVHPLFLPSPISYHLLHCSTAPCSGKMSSPQPPPWRLGGVFYTRLSMQLHGSCPPLQMKKTPSPPALPDPKRGGKKEKINLWSIKGSTTGYIDIIRNTLDLKIISNLPYLN